MARLPEPQPGLVISYAYLWSEESGRGRLEGRKDRPCAVVLALDRQAHLVGDTRQVAVAPITHIEPANLRVAVEIPTRVKLHLGLDGERSWVILNEVNVFGWPGFDLRPIRRGEGRVDYGFLPPRFFQVLIEKFKELEAFGEVGKIDRD